MKKKQKQNQLKLTNPKRAGRPAIRDKGIRHRRREYLHRPRALHLTVKLNRADIRTKTVLAILKNAIMRARLRGLRIIHFSLEHNHVHLFAECGDNLVLSKAMQGFGVSLAKRINGAYKLKGQRYKHRYHLRVLKSATDVRNVIRYILKNGIKHGSARTIIQPYNSALVLHNWRVVNIRMKRAEIASLLAPFEKRTRQLRDLLDDLVIFRRELRFTFG